MGISVGNPLKPCPRCRKIRKKKARRVGLSVRTAGKEKAVREDELKERLSALPDEILVSIISRLTMKEAAKLSVLSHKWNFLWLNFPTLDFEDLSRTNMCAIGAAEFIGWVDNILDQHLGPAIDVFRVSFYLTNEYKSFVDKWLVFAFTKQVKRLELDSHKYLPCYEATVYKLELRNCITKLPHNDTIRLALESLCLKGVKVNANEVEWLLSSFPFLNKLWIYGAYCLTSIRCHSDVPLKYLYVHQCSSLDVIDLCAPKLLYFSYGHIGKHQIEIRIRNASLLSMLSLSVKDSAFLDSFSNYFQQLTYLELRTWLGKQFNSRTSPYNNNNYRKLVKLKHLEFHFNGIDDSSTLVWAPLIEASPLLHKLTLTVSMEYTIREIVKHESRSLKSLKTLEFKAYRGRTADLEMASYVFSNAPNLKKVIVSFDETPRKDALKSILKLKEMLPQGVKFIVRPNAYCRGE